LITRRGTAFAGLAVAAALLVACGRNPAIEDQSPEPDAEALSPGDEVPPIPASSAPFYVGKWAARAEWCDAAPGVAEGPILIAGTKFIGPSLQCRIGRAVEGTEGGWRLERVCRRDGVETTDEIDVDVDGEMLRIAEAGAPEVALTRCRDD
jgi:hypothetical protein